MNELVAPAGMLRMGSIWHRPLTCWRLFPHGSLWLVNFTSENTRGDYKRTVGRFIATMGIETPEALYRRFSGAFDRLSG